MSCQMRKHWKIHYFPIQKVCINTCSGREKFRGFQIILDIGSSSNVFMGKLTSKININDYVGDPIQEFNGPEDDECKVMLTIV